MAIRDRFRRALHKSGSSESISPSDCSSSTAFTSSTRRSSSSGTSSPVGPIKSASSQSSSSRLSKTFSFGSRDRGKDKEGRQAKAEVSKPNKGKTRPSRTPKTTYQHPSQRPLTEQNLRHQEMLGRFTMTFGTSNLAQLEADDYGGVSPCCTRPCSRNG